MQIKFRESKRVLLPTFRQTKFQMFAVYVDNNSVGGHITAYDLGRRATDNEVTNAYWCAMIRQRRTTNKDKKPTSLTCMRATFMLAV